MILSNYSSVKLAPSLVPVNGPRKKNVVLGALYRIQSCKIIWEGLVLHCLVSISKSPFFKIRSVYYQLCARWIIILILMCGGLKDQIFVFRNCIRFFFDVKSDIVTVGTSQTFCHNGRGWDKGIQEQHYHILRRTKIRRGASITVIIVRRRG